MTNSGSTSYWLNRIGLFNVVVLGSYFAAFAVYVAILQAFTSTIGRPVIGPDGTTLPFNSIDFEDGPFGLLPCCCLPALVIPFINAVYFLGPAFAYILSLAFRKVGDHPNRVWWLFTVLIAAPPWLIPAFHLVAVVFFPQVYDQTPIRF